MIANNSTQSAEMKGAFETVANRLSQKMIVRVTAKLSAKLKVAPPTALPPDANPLADWTANLFTARHTQHVIATNTASLYSFIFPGRGLASERQFVAGFLESLQLSLAADRFQPDYQKWIEPTTNQMLFSKAFNRSVTGSMNDLVFQARLLLADGDLSSSEISSRLNDTPLSFLNYRNPRKAFRELLLPKSNPE